MESLQNGLQLHSGATQFISIDFNESYIASVDTVLMLTLWCKRALTLQTSLVWHSTGLQWPSKFKDLFLVSITNSVILSSAHYVIDS